MFSVLSNTNFFPIFRGALLGVVAAWTLIVLGIAIHFQMSFVDSASQLTYVSLSVFVAVVTLTLFLVLLVAPCNRKISEILKTKWELLWLGVLSVLWTSLAGYTTTPAAKDNEVECWDEDEDGNIVDQHVEGYSNDVYHARYRVLQAFAFFNCVLLLFLFLFILVLAFWHHKRGRYVIWTTRTTSVGWFDQPGGFGTALAKRLPAPITNRVSKVFGLKDDEEKYEKWDDAKQAGSGKKKHFKFENDEKRGSSYRDKSKDKDADLEEMGLLQKPQKPAPAAHRDTNPNIKNAARNKSPEPKKESTVARNKSPEPKKESTTPMKPRQYVVGVPKDSVKPTLAPLKTTGLGNTSTSAAPIAARMEEEKKKAADLQRNMSQREAADKARQEARRGRGTSDEERRPRATTRPSATEGQRNASAARREPSQGHKRSESKPPAGAVGVARRETSRDPSGRQGQGQGSGLARQGTQTSQASQPGVVRSGSGAGRNGTGQPRARADNTSSESNEATRRAVPGRQGRTNNNLNNYQSNNPYRSATGKRV